VTKHFITFSDRHFNLQKRIAVSSAKWLGGFDTAIGYGPDDIDINFQEKYKNILSNKKGLGCWLWKPYFILKRLMEIEMNDFLFYADAGSFFLNDIKILLNRIVGFEPKQDVFGFELPFIEKQWTKKELFTYLDCQDDSYKDYKETNQINGSFHLIRKTPSSIAFYQNYLTAACIDRNIDGDYNKNIQDVTFIDHRYDQSIFSLLYKKYRYVAFQDPSQYGNQPYLYLDIESVSLKYGQLVTLPSGVMYKCKEFTHDDSFIIFHYRKNNPFYRYIIFYAKKLRVQFLVEFHIKK